MTVENLKEIIVEVIRVVVTLQDLKKKDEYEEVGCSITFKGEKTGKRKVINVSIDKENKIKIDGDAPFLNVVQKAVQDYINEATSE